MSSKTSLVGFIALGLSSHAVATDGGHSGQGDLLVCPISCIQTVTVTSIAELPSTLHTPIPTDIAIHNNDGVYVNATATEPSAVPYTTIIIMPTGVITGSAAIAEHTPATHSYRSFNSIVADLEITSLNVSSPTPSSSYTDVYTSVVHTAATSDMGTISSIATVPATSISNSSPPALSTVKPNGCHHNNCLRQFIRHTQLTDFCATYTTTINAATTNLPDYVSQCHADPTRISSACSCIVTSLLPSDSVYSKPLTTKTAGGAFTFLPHNTVTNDPAVPTTAEGCTLSSVIFETHTNTNTFSITVSVGADIPMSTHASEVEILTSSHAILSFTSITYFNSSTETMTSLPTSTH
ncbi:hypothetical protein BKA65DRAFT_536912 [Rhexocercosporidium sp. MPI-PUGE-AT-0058]|nr:hypothetical protein BKA65DRAFT_536912 [Rhexocercosporidium sp. MPI-PUGE-AT-0058]